MKVKYYSKKGVEIKTGFDLQDSVVNSKINESLLTQYALAYTNGQRQSNAQVKDRGEVRGGGKKPWKQKGTGRARAGSSRSPIWRGGGVTFGPSNVRNYKTPLSKKMIKGAFRSAFSLINKKNKLFIIEKLGFEKANTKELADILNKITESKITLVQNGNNKALSMSASNNKNIELININELNPYQIIRSRNLILIEDTISYVNEKWGRGKVVKIDKQVKTSSPVKAVVVKKTIVKKATVIKKKVTK